MNDIERLQAIDDIKRLKGSYCRFIDTKQWAAYGNLFAPDAILEVNDYVDGPDGTPGVSEGKVIKMKGRGQIVEQVSGLLKQCRTVHQVHSPEIEVTSPATAKGIWAMEDRLRWTDRAISPIGLLFLHGFGHYHETYARQEGRWVIASLKLTRLSLENT